MKNLIATLMMFIGMLYLVQALFSVPALPHHQVKWRLLTNLGQNPRLIFGLVGLLMIFVGGFLWFL